jgi:hypothetical protein
MPTPILIPVDLKALAVSRQDDGSAPVPGGGYPATSQFGGIEILFETLPFIDPSNPEAPNNPALGAYATPDPFALVSPSRQLLAGVHLHWALPDALAHGHTDGSQKPAYPEAPNRWLVVRSAADAAGKPLAQAAWVVESDHLWVDPPPAKPSALGDPQPDRNEASPLVLDLQRFEAGGVIPALRQGRVFDFASWVEDPKAQRAPSCTAVGFGVPEFSAAYVHSKNIFGFWDRADDLDALAAAGPVKLSYQVHGWYSDLDRDPVRALAAQAKGDPKALSALFAKRFSWSVPVADASGLPDRALCQGLLSAVPWSTTQAALVPSLRPNKPLVAIGNTTAEAMAAYASARSPFAGDERFEALLRAIELGLAPSAASDRGFSQIDEASHQAQFQSLKGGCVWSVQSASGVSTPAGSVDTALLRNAASNTLGRLPPAAADALNDLNAAQAALDEAARHVQAERSQLFADWQMTLYCLYPGDQDMPNYCTPQNAVSFFNTRANDGPLAKALSAQKDALAQRDALRAKLAALLPTDTSTPPKPLYAIQAGSADPFWQAAEPVMVLSDDLLQASPRWGSDGRFREDGLLACRLPSQRVDAMKFGAANLAAADLPLLSLPASLELAAPFLAESMLLDPIFSLFFADLLLSKAVPPPGAPDAATLASLIERDLLAAFQPARQAALAGALGLPAAQAATDDAPLGEMADPAWSGQMPSPVGLDAWAQPFLPLVIQWKVSFAPDKRVQLPDAPMDAARGVSADAGSESAEANPFPIAYGQDFISSGYALSPDDTDLQRRSGAYPIDSATALEFTGSVTLSPNPSASLKKRLRDWGLGDSDLARQGAPALVSQSLQGFNQRLFMRDQALQLPVYDPLNNPPAPGYDVAQARGLIGDERSLAIQSDTEALNGIRSGYFRLLEARVVDSFGQVLDFPCASGQVVYSSAFPQTSDPATGASYAQLAPRVSQPARVDFKWRSASDGQQESNALPASSPIFGWILANHLDNAMDVYSADGLPVGSFRAPAAGWSGSTATFWQPAPMQKAFRLDPSLEQFIAGFRSLSEAPNKPGDGPAYVAAILDCVENASASFVSPRLAQDDAKAVLFSRPLALARASVGLGLYGPPALSQSWSAYAQQLTAIGTQQPLPPRFNGGFDQVDFFVEIGDASDPDEAVVGFFKHADAQTPKAADFTQFFSAAAAQSGAGVQAGATLSLSLSDAAQCMTVLLDPRGSLSATTGVLPVKTLLIPPEHYDQALKNISVSFLAAPLLLDASQPAAPLPSEAKSSWSLISRSSQGWSRQPIEANGARATDGRYPLSLVEGWLNLSNKS